MAGEWEKGKLHLIIAGYMCIWKHHTDTCSWIQFISIQLHTYTHRHMHRHTHTQRYSYLDRERGERGKKGVRKRGREEKTIYNFQVGESFGLPDSKRRQSIILLNCFSFTAISTYIIND